MAADPLSAGHPAAIVISRRLIIVSRLRHYRRDYYGVAYAFRNGDAGWRQPWLYIRFCSERYFSLAGKLADLTETKYRSAYMDRDCP